MQLIINVHGYFPQTNLQIHETNWKWSFFVCGEYNFLLYLLRAACDS